MMKALRRHKDWLMIVIAILAIPFIFYFVQRPDYGAMRSDQFARMYDRNVSMLEAQQIARLLTLAQALGMSEFVQTLTAGAGQNQNQVAVQFIINLLVLRHEAELLGVRPDASEIADVVRKLPAFQNESGFDMNKFSDFVRSGLGPMGLGEEHIEQLVRDELCLNEIKRLLATGISISKGEVDENFQRGYDKFYVNVIRFHTADFDKDIKVNDEDVQKYYDAHKTELKTDEKRKVEFVNLGLTEEPAEYANLPAPLSQPAYSSIFIDRFIQNLIGFNAVAPLSFANDMTAQRRNEQKTLTGTERIDALQKLADRATDFTQALLEKGADFRQAAGKFQLSVHETGEFTAAAPDPQLKVDAQLGAAAFKLTAQEPNSDPIQMADGFYILHLVGITEARPLTVEEAKPKIVDALKKGRARELMSTNGAELAQQLRGAAKSGQPLEASIQKAGAKAEKLPPFSLFEEEKPRSEGNEPNNEPLSQAEEPQNEPASQGSKEPKNKPASQGKEPQNERPSQSEEPKNKPASQGKESKNEPSSQGKEPKNEPPSQSKKPTNEPSDLAAIKEAVAFLNPGEVSDFSPSGNDGFIAVLEKREPSADTEAGEKRAAFEKRLLDNKERIVFYEWLRDRQQAAGLQFSKG
jgi:outer membrane biosynthesis protein TonB